MASKLASAFVEIGTRDSRFKSGLRSVKGQLTGFVTKMAPIAAALGAALGLKASIAGARKQIDAEKKLAAVLRATGGAAGLSADEIKKHAAALQKVTNFGDEVTISAAAVLATFKNIKGDQFKELLEVSQDVSEVMGQDLNSSVLQLGKAMNDPATGLTMLTRVGITFNEQQKAQIKLLSKSGDRLGAQAIIMKELRSQFGGAAKAMADPLTQASNKLGDIGEGIGNLVLPSINAMADAFLGAGLEGENFGTRMKRIGQDIAFMFVNLGTTVKVTALGWAVDLLDAQPDMEQPITNFAEFFVSTFAGLGAFFDTFIGTLKGGLEEAANLAEAFRKGSTGDDGKFTFGLINKKKFNKALAEQEDVDAPDAFAEYAKAAKEAGAAWRKGIKENGGLTKATKAELAKQEKLLADAMAADLKRRKEQEDLLNFTPGGEPTDDGAAKAVKAADRKKIGFAGITDLSRQIQANLGLTKEQKEARETAKNTEKIAETNKAIAAAVKTMAANPLTFGLT